MVRAFRAFLDFAYTARRAFLAESHINKLKDALERFHRYRRVFATREDDEGNWITAPRQHSMVHYPYIAELFGAPTGLCTSITESKHIVAVKRPYRRSSHHDALAQIILVNQRLDKLAALRHVLTDQGLLCGSILKTLGHLQRDLEQEEADVTEQWRNAYVQQDEDEQLDDGQSSADDDDDETEVDTDDAEEDEEDKDDDDDAGPVDDDRASSHVFMARGYGKLKVLVCIALGADLTHVSVKKQPRTVYALAQALQMPRLPELTREFLANQLAAHTGDGLPPPAHTIAAGNARVWIHTSATALYHAPSDPSGVHGMKREAIRCTTNWCRRGRREDCVLVDVDPDDAPGGIQAARLKLLFSVQYGHDRVKYPCALVHWYADHSPDPDPDTGMRVLLPSTCRDGTPDVDVISLDSLIRGAHLTAVYGPSFVPNDLKFGQTLDYFQAFYLNSYIDHHMYDLLH
jgi:hypothetical protein